MKIKCLIIYDDPSSINIIQSHLHQNNGFELVETFNDTTNGLIYLNQNPVDLIFLDVNMSTLEGLDYINSLEDKPLVIITSTHDKFAVKAYELNVLDYLIKPISFTRFTKSLNKVYKTFNEKRIFQHNKNEKKFIFIKIDNKKMQKINLDELLVIECLKDYLKIITSTKNYIIHKTLGSFTKQLPSEKFIRIHRSFTISVDKIDAIEGNIIEVGGLKYIIGRSYTKEVKSQILSSLIC